MTNTCKVCDVTSDAAEFYKGVNTLCKECHKLKVRENRLSKIDYYREYDAKRFQNDPKVKERHLRYQSTDAGRASMQKARRKWMTQNADARAAHIILGNAVRDGRIDKPNHCTDCGFHTNKRNMHAHHEDYAKPLDVIWLCAQCHHDTHTKGEPK